MVQQLFVFKLEAISEKNKKFYARLQKKPKCPECHQILKNLRTLSQHLRESHGINFTQWMLSKFPNYCRKCGKHIIGRVQDVYKVSFCSLSCKQAKEFKSELQMEIARCLGRIWKGKSRKPESIAKRLATMKGRPSPLRGRKMPEHVCQAISRRNKEWLRLHGHPFKGKHHSIQSRLAMSQGKRNNRAKSWDGNFTKFQSLVRDALFNIWTKPILARDQYRCSKCDSIDDLSVHHLIPFRDLVLQVLNMNPHLDIMKYEDKWKLQEACLSYKPLLDLTNGITLCIKCHRKKHRKAA